ncbi:hypothetical protein D5278_06300 [bacterium 1XD21-13]|nr:hypothetical protein [bacterium 1XD21-13]
MCHRSGKPSAMDLPPSCKAAADRMEQALRQEDLDSYRTARLTESAVDSLSDAEQRLSRELGRDIVLVAYESK